MSAEEVEARIRGYCARYGVAPNAEGLPPFPTGRRETPQHREWLAVYKAHQRLRRRGERAEEKTSGPAGAGE